MVLEKYFWSNLGGKAFFWANKHFFWSKFRENLFFWHRLIIFFGYWGLKKIKKAFLSFLGLSKFLENRFYPRKSSELCEFSNTRSSELFYQKSHLWVKILAFFYHNPTFCPFTPLLASQGDKRPSQKTRPKLIFHDHILKKKEKYTIDDFYHLPREKMSDLEMEELKQIKLEGSQPLTEKLTNLQKENSIPKTPDNNTSPARKTSQPYINRFKLEPTYKK